MKTTKLLSLLALLSFITVATAPAAPITFDPTNPLIVSNQGGFTGFGSSPGNPYTQARLFFNFSDLSPIPLPSSFDITDIAITGPGITSSLSFSPLSITGNGFFFTGFVALNSSVPSLDFASDGVTASFSLPSGVINFGSSFSVLVQYADPSGFLQTSTSDSGPIYSAEAPPPPPPAAIPEPASVGMLLFGAAAVYSFRRRRDDV
jgi:hypothetical protein